MAKIILAYSGGLDTSIILKWLIEKDHDVVAYIADVGQDEDFEAAKAKALSIGASKVYIEDLKEEFVKDYIFPAFSANVIYEGRYLLGTALARPLIAKKQIEIAAKENAEYVSHGATGKGNDQVRFELAYYALNPDIKVIAPWKDEEFLEQFKGRDDLIAYADAHDIPVTATKAKPYSEDSNLLHISHEAGVLEDPSHIADESVYSWTKSPKDAPDCETVIEITFKDGIPVKVENLNDKTIKENPLELFSYLNDIGANNGIGRIDIVEDRYVGIKSRGIYETPGGTILHIAHMDIEGIAMDREVMRLRDSMTSQLSELIYNGYWFSPEFDFLTAAITESQKVIDGTVTLSIYKGNVMAIARSSPSSLYDEDLSSMNIEGGYNQEDAEGFIKINSIRLKAHHAITHKRKKNDKAMGNE